MLLEEEGEPNPMPQYKRQFNLYFLPNLRTRSWKTRGRSEDA